MEAIEELSQLSDSMRQASALLADEDVDETSSSVSSRRASTFLNVFALENTVRPMYDNRFQLACQRRPNCVRILLSSGALVCASTGGYSYHGSTSLHLAAHGGSFDCVRELLAWGADRLQRDSAG
ncbi:putative E3 ubiquitin-protein ligase xbat31 [Phtheirospermum japonicum]|uniref:Putative E3 ubiquitin-protein ligase xbat31 n=1 Tax=Phtheirospermum japonicum TaxID=374723 RepID=A0A830BV84_9LAMI|nr:putative E3 ubiquitin-protein ligase xbat31 [Phtheirospermum japonicum]